MDAHLGIWPVGFAEKDAINMSTYFAGLSARLIGFHNNGLDHIYFYLY
jgi:hypothetical protein